MPNSLSDAATAQYAIGGYAVGALDYVLKPVPYFAFSQQLRNVARSVGHQDPRLVEGIDFALRGAGIAAVAGKDFADFRESAVFIVRGAFHNDGHGTGTVAFVSDFFI